MTEGATPGPDGAASGGAEDETVAFGPSTELPAPLPASPSPPPPRPDAEGSAGADAEGSTPWPARPGAPAPTTTTRLGGPATPDPAPPGPAGAPPAAPIGPGPRRADGSWNALTIVAVGGVVVLVVVIVLMAVVLGFGDDDTGDVATSDPTSTTATTVPTSTASTTTGPTPTEPGLLCRDLLADGASYELAVAYWLQQGRPPQMDEDRNGIPCETVYPAAAVEAVWGPAGLADDGVAPGLLCRDLFAMGLDYQAAVAYWLEEGEPARMDDDGNGRPCETVYPPEDVAAFWR